jgi:hypothetical protein
MLAYMNVDHEMLTFLTIDSIQWATGGMRPRMTLEDKRAKHRVHQRQFVLRQRERLNQLRREQQCCQLQLQRLQAFEEADALRKENDLLRKQLAAGSLPTASESLLPIPGLSPVQPELQPKRLNASQIDHKNEAAVAGDSFIREMMTLLPEMDTSGVRADDSPSYIHQDLTSTAAICDFAIA